VLSETDQFRDGRWAILGTKPNGLKKRLKRQMVMEEEGRYM
jgi:hypothetical protein